MKTIIEFDASFQMMRSLQTSASLKETRNLASYVSRQNLKFLPNFVLNLVTF